jgi:hypothetical protein
MQQPDVGISLLRTVPNSPELVGLDSLHYLARLASVYVEKSAAGCLQGRLGRTNQAGCLLGYPEQSLNQSLALSLTLASVACSGQPG